MGKDKVLEAIDIFYNAIMDSTPETSPDICGTREQVRTSGRITDASKEVAARRMARFMQYKLCMNPTENLEEQYHKHLANVTLRISKLSDGYIEHLCNRGYTVEKTEDSSLRDWHEAQRSHVQEILEQPYGSL